MEMNIERYAATSLAAIMSVLLLVGMVFAVTSDPVSTTATVTVNEYLSISLSGSVAFGNVNDDSVDNPDTEPLVVTIGAETNVGNIDVRTKANSANFAGTGTLAVSNMKWYTTDFPSGTAYTTSDANACTGLSASGTCSIDHTLSVPGTVAAGGYSVGITITAENV